MWRLIFFNVQYLSKFSISWWMINSMETNNNRTSFLCTFFTFHCNTICINLTHTDLAWLAASLTECPPSLPSCHLADTLGLGAIASSVSHRHHSLHCVTTWSPPHLLVVRLSHTVATPTLTCRSLLWTATFCSHRFCLIHSPCPGIWGTPEWGSEVFTNWRDVECANVTTCHLSVQSHKSVIFVPWQLYFLILQRWKHPS